MADHTDHRDVDPDFDPPPFSLALMGHLATGLVKAAVIAVLLWLLGLTGITAEISAGSAVSMAVVVMIAVEVVTAGVERVFVMREQHPDPGSVPMAVAVALLPFPVSAVVALLAGATTSGVFVTAAVTVLVYWGTMIGLERPWTPGDTRDDVRRKIEQTRAMSREHFRRE